MAKLGTGELEAAVMDVLWRDGGWLTPGEVHDVMSRSRPLAYTTVMTILVRLWNKGRLERERDGRAFAYHATQSREVYTAERMRDLLAAATDRSIALGHFLHGLNAKDRAQLRRLLKTEGA